VTRKSSPKVLPDIALKFRRAAKQKRPDKAAFSGCEPAPAQSFGSASAVFSSTGQSRI